MAVSKSNLLGSSSTNATSATTASVTPGANKLELLAVSSRTGITANPNQPTVTGNGLTWVAINTIIFDTTSSSRRRLTLFRAMGASPSTGAITIDFAGQTQTDITWILDEFTGMDTSGTNGSGAIVQSNTNSDETTTATALTVSLSAFGNANNAAYGVFSNTVTSSTVTAGSGFTISANIVSGTNIRATSEFEATSNISVAMSWSASGDQFGGIGVEIKLSGTSYTQSLTASVSFTGIHSKIVNYPHSASLSFSGAMGGRFIVAILSSSLSFSGQLLRALTLHGFTASFGFTGSFLHTAQKWLTGSLGLNNVLPNGSFENAPVSNIAPTTAANVWINGTASGSGASSGFGWGTSAITQGFSAGFDSSQSHSGIYSMKLSTLDATGQATIGTYTTNPPTGAQTYQLFILQPSTKYTITGWIKTNNVASNSAFIDVREYNSSVSTVTTTSTNKLSGTNGWTQVTATFTTQPTTAYGTVFLRNNVAGNVGDAWFDDIVLQPNPANIFIKLPMKALTAALSYTGNLLKATIHAFTGVLSFTGAFVSGTLRFSTLTAALSFSGIFSKTQQKQIRSALKMNNVVPNGSFEVYPSSNIAATSTVNRWIDGTAAGSTTNSDFGWGTASLNGTAQASFDSTNSHSGSYSIKLSTLSTSVDNIVVGNYRQTPSDGVLFRLTPSVSYTLTGWIKTNNVAANGAFIDVREYDAALSTITTTSSSKLSGTNGWTQVSFTFTAQSNTAFATIFLRNNIVGNISDVWFDDITLTPTASQFVRQTRRSLTATLGFTGTFSKLPTRALTAILSFAGTITRNIFKLLPSYLSFMIPPDSTGSGLSGGSIGGDPLGGGYDGTQGAGFTKKTMRSLSATTSFSGNISRNIGHTMSATLSFSGSLARRIARSFTAGLSFVGGITTRILHLVSFAANLLFTGNINRQVKKSLSASLPFTGVINKTDQRSFSASISPSGSLIKRSVRNFTATLGMTGNLAKTIRRSLTAALPTSGVLLRSTNRLLNASTGFSGALNKTGNKSFTASVGFVGSISRTILKAFSASIGFIGRLTTISTSKTRRGRPIILRDRGNKTLLTDNTSKRPTVLGDEDRDIRLM